VRATRKYLPPGENLMAITVMGAMNGSAFESFFSIPVEQHTGLI
jgi:hypothetical protein